MTIFKRIEQLCSQKGINITQLEKACGLSQNSIRKWDIRDSLPNGETAIRIADYFNITTDFLLGRADMPAALAYQIPYEDSNPRGVRFVDGLEGLSRSDREDIMNYIEFKRAQKNPHSTVAIDAPEGWNKLSPNDRETVQNLVNSLTGNNKEKQDNKEKTANR